MRPVIVSTSGVSTSAWVPMDREQAPFTVGVGVVISGTVTYNVEHTFDDPSNSPTAFIATGFNAATANANGNYAFPVRAIRLNQTAGTGSATMTLIQARR